MLVYIVCFPLTVLAIIICFFSFLVGPIVWVITGDEEKAWNAVYGGIQGWLISLPWKLTGRDDD